MSKIITITLVLITVIFSNCGNNTVKDTGNSGSQSAQNGTGEIVFKEYEHDFGKVSEGEKVAYVFTFENKGTSDLIVKSATTSCGCTIPKFSKKPVPPGGNGSLEVIFDTSGREGIQTKTIGVKSNGTVPVVLLKITAEVVSKINNNN